MMHCWRTLAKLPSNLIMYNSLKVIVTTMISFVIVTWQPFLPQWLAIQLKVAKWRANHSCDNNLLTVVNNQIRKVLIVSLNNALFSKLVF